jgi:hypothetical protein
MNKAGVLFPRQRVLTRLLVEGKLFRRIAMKVNAPVFARGEKEAL